MIPLPPSSSSSSATHPFSTISEVTVAVIVVLRVQHPGVAEVAKDLFDGAAAVLIHGQQPAEHAKGLLGEASPLGWHRGRPPPLPANELLVEGIRWQRLLPGEVARQHAEEQHAKGPDIGAVVHTETLVAGHIAELWGRVGDGATHLEGNSAGQIHHAKMKPLKFICSKL